ncbi:MAG: glycosyltransferase [Cyanobacteria bacterium P01_D01_bin.105]
MRLLWVTERFPPDIGGVARSAGRIVRSLTTLGIAVDVVTWSRYLEPGDVLPPEASPVDADTDSDKVRVYRIGLYRNWDMTLPHTLNLLDWLQAKQPFDAVWGHYLFPSGFVAAWFAKLNGISSVVSARGNDVDRGMFPPGDFSRLQWTLANASVVTAVSQEMATKVEALSNRTVNVLTNVVNQEVFNFSEIKLSEKDNSLKEQLGILPEESVLGFSGELREKKGQRFLLQALSEVRAQRPACLLIIGELRPESQQLLQQFAAANPEDGARIIVTGHLDKPARVAEHLRLCDVYLQPSLWDGMPNALLEAMACGCGCIGSDAGGIPDVIEHGVSGFVIGRSHLHRLGEATLEYLNLAPSLRAGIRQKASQRITEQFTLAREAAMLKTLMMEIMPTLI